MCVLRVGGSRLVPVDKTRSWSDIRIGEDVYSLGSPSGYENTFSKGGVTGKRILEGRKFIQTDAGIFPGSSGGGLFDAEGHLIGITSNYEKGTTLGFAIPIDSFSAALRGN